MKVFGVEVGKRPTLFGSFILLPLLIGGYLAIGGGVVWAITNVLSVAVHSANVPNLNFWESALVFGSLWLMARLLSDRS